jgi:hypothetical protein
MSESRWDLRTYLAEIVNPTINELEAEPTSIRRAFLACVVTFHAIDYLVYPKRPGARRSQFRKQSRAFSVVDRVAHAIKHVKAGKAEDPQNQPLDPKDVISRPPGYFDGGYLDISRYDDLVGGVTARNDPEADLLAIVKETAQFLARVAP